MTSYAPKPSYESLEETIDDLKSESESIRETSYEMTKTIMFILMKWRQSGRIMDEYQQTRKESLQPLKDEWKKLTEALESLSD